MKLLKVTKFSWAFIDFGLWLMWPACLIFFYIDTMPVYIFSVCVSSTATTTKCMSWTQLCRLIAFFTFPVNFKVPALIFWKKLFTSVQQLEGWPRRRKTWVQILTWPRSALNDLGPVIISQSNLPLRVAAKIKGEGEICTLSVAPGRMGEIQKNEKRERVDCFSY